jgi:hypothetical protein
MRAFSGKMLQTPWGLALLWGSALLVHSLSLGVSDDEAYYWVLAQRPALGYAYHPPMIAWVIGVFDSFVRGSAPEWLRILTLRAPALLTSISLLGAMLTWLRDQGDPEQTLARQALVALSVAGLFGLAWMIVPDQPLFLGWLLLFLGVESLRIGRSTSKVPLLLGLGVMLTVLSKFSGVLAVGSAALVLFFSASIRWSRRLGWMAFLGVLSMLALLPVIHWNLSRGGGALAYQFKGRQTGGFSWLRGARFWGIQLALCGPLVLWTLGFAAQELARGVRSLMRREWPQLDERAMLALWILPPLFVFGVQPFFAEYKAHWIFVAWLPGILAFARHASRRWRRAQLWVGLPVLLLLWAVPRFPLISLIVEPDPKKDLSFDLRGWSELPARVARFPEWGKSASEHGGTVRLVGSRYQTASQAAWALGRVDWVSLLPVDLSQREEWGVDGTLIDLGRSSVGVWPALKRSVFYVRDERYDEPPRFPGVQCRVLERFTPEHFGFRGKWIELQFCEPESPSRTP